MSSKDHDSNQSAVEKFEAARRRVAKKIFGAPVDWAKVFAPKPREVDAEEFLREALASGPRVVSDLRSMAAEKGISWSRVQRAAHYRVNVIARQATPGRWDRWEWCLTAPTPKAPAKAALKPNSEESGRTKIVNARKQFDRKFYGALRSLGLQATTKRACVWIEGYAVHFFDLALEKDLARFDRFKRDVLARVVNRRKNA